MDDKPTELFGDLDLERRIALDHPRRAIRALVDKALTHLSPAFANARWPAGHPA